MKKFLYIVMAMALLTAFGCGKQGEQAAEQGGQATEQATQQAEHPQGEHPQGEQPAEHPQGQMPGDTAKSAEHPN